MFIGIRNQTPIRAGRLGLYLLFGVVAGLAGIFLVLVAGNSQATETFMPGRIIDDSVMVDTDSINSNQIQTFLEAKVRGGKCNRHKTSSRSEQKGLTPPWTCLFEFRQNPVTGAHNYGQFDDNGQPAAVAGGQTAAELIWRVAQDHQINPQVILVWLQKQQGLITDDWPWSSQYSAATGWTCPSQDPCHPDQATFYRQIDGFARQLRADLDGPDQRTFRVGVNQIAYHPSASCGRATVTIQTSATAALYNQSLYTPNQAALNNLYGEGDACSSYGIRNFWIQFNAWFGSTTPESRLPTAPTPPPASSSWPIVVLNGQVFDSGKIISDHNFTNATSMTPEQIHWFIGSRLADADPDRPGKQCARWRQSELSQRLGLTPPWTCLFEFRQNPVTGAHNYGQFDDNGQPAAVAGGQTAAELIWQAAQDHQINPQVLLVLLEKEQSLLSDQSPWPRDYSKATGWACPDTSPCDPKTASFHHQINFAAAGLRRYIDNLDRYWYRIGSNQILFHPNRNCGTRIVEIKNKATVALYLYTPYQPNPAALNNLRGIGDSCSSYGNRNFWTYYNDWFGAPLDDNSSNYQGPSQNLPFSPPPTTNDDPTNPDDFEPTTFSVGHIISNADFANHQTMTIAEIDSFIRQRLIDSDGDDPGNQCNRQKQPNRAAVSRGLTPPWTCLFEFRQNPVTGAHNYGQFDDNGQPTAVASGQTAAELIWQAAQDHQINPQVILTILEKEQWLLTDNWPWATQFARAGGQTCSTPACNDPADFNYQLRRLAQNLSQQFRQPQKRMFRIGSNRIAYHPSASCGQATVTIHNAATAALYHQDPYVANEAATAGSLTAAGNACSSYGIRNFWVIYRAWFKD